MQVNCFWFNRLKQLGEWLILHHRLQTCCQGALLYINVCEFTRIVGCTAIYVLISIVIFRGEVLAAEMTPLEIDVIFIALPIFTIDDESKQNVANLLSNLLLGLRYVSGVWEASPVRHLTAGPHRMSTISGT